MEFNTKKKTFDPRIPVRAEDRRQKQEVTRAAKAMGKSVNKYFLWLHCQYMAKLERKAK